MLSILLKGVRLDLPADFQLNLVYENPIFLQDRIPSQHSLTFDLPSTSHNLSILGNPNRIASALKGLTEYEDCEIRFGPIILLKGVLVVQRWDQVIKAFFRSRVINDLIKKPVSQSTIETFEFGQGNTGFPGFDDPNAFGYKYNQLIESTVPGDQKFVVPPVRIKDSVWPYIEEGTYPTTFGIIASFYMYLNFYNIMDEGYLMSSFASQYHTGCFPSPFVHYLVDKFFGSQLESNPFLTGELSKLVIFNSHHPDFNLFSPANMAYGVILDSYNLGFQGDILQYFKIQSFADTNPFIDTFKEILKMICASLLTIPDGFKIVFLKDVIQSSKSENWTRNLIGKLTTERRLGLNYIFGYAGNSTDEKASSHLQVNNIWELLDFEPDPEEEIEVYVVNTDQLFSIRKREAEEGDPDRYIYTVKENGYYGSGPGTKDSDYNMSSNIRPLDMNLHEVWWDDIGQMSGNKIEFSHWYVPEWGGDRLVRPDKPYIMLYQGLRDSFKGVLIPTIHFKKYPFLSGHNYDAHGNKVGTLSLHWNGEDGLIENYHTEFKEWIEKDKLAAEGFFELSAADLKNFDFTKKKYVKGKNFFVEKLEVTITDKIDPARVLLIEE